MTIPTEIDLFLAKKRYRKSQKRKLIKELRRASEVTQAMTERQRFGPRSKIVQMMADSFVAKIEHPGKELTLVIPATFSVIEDPLNTIRILQWFASCARKHRVGSIYIDQSKLVNYDLAANALLDLLATEIEVENRQNKSKLRFHGAYPKDPAVKRFIKSIGIVKHLKIRNEQTAPHEVEKIRLFDKRFKHYSDLTDGKKADFKTKTIVGFADHINRCLGDHRKALTQLARHRLCEYVGEILDNAEQHSAFRDWTIQGYLDNSLDVPICEIALFNFGKSIARTLDELPVDSYTYKQINTYLQLHGGMGFFSKAWRKADLLTLMALQSHVSSKNTTEETTRGQGTVDLIEFFQNVYRECVGKTSRDAKMTIVSGGTYILFDGSYKMREKNGAGGKIIAFNQENDLLLKPDPKYVVSLGSLHFPGTIISIRFPLAATSTVTLDEN